MIIRYALAQLLILAFWIQDWYRHGSSDISGGAPILGPLLFVLLFAGIPALGVGLVDGLAGGAEEGLSRRVILTVLVVILALWIGIFGVASIGLEDLFGQTGNPPSVASRIGGLIAMETVFFLELGTVIFVRWLRDS